MAAARAEEDVAAAAYAVWLLGVCLAAAGRYGTALGLLSPVLESAEEAAAAAPVREAGARCAAVMASVHRQLGHSAAALDVDLRGLLLTDGAGVAAFDCRVGLAADAVGLGDHERAAAELAEAARLLADGAVPAVDPAAGADTDWRARVRIAWVRAELAVLEGRPADGVAEAAAAAELAREAGAPRHLAKSQLMQGVAEVRSGAATAPQTLAAAATAAAELGALSLVWPARALLGALLAASDREAALANLAGARDVVLRIADDLPDGPREEWLARPDVAALLSA